MTKTQYDEDHPEVIKARAEAKRTILEARKQLHPVAQIIYAVFDGATSFIESIGCLILILILILALVAPAVLPRIFGQ